MVHVAGSYYKTNMNQSKGPISLPSSYLDNTSWGYDQLVIQKMSQQYFHQVQPQQIKKCMQNNHNIINYVKWHNWSIVVWLIFLGRYIYAT
jgi:hypothetical protein